jgi:hypothetical protein
MGDSEFADDLDAYLDGDVYPNLEMADLEIVWIDNNPSLGSLHMQLDHNVQKEEVEEALLELPPEVEAKRNPEYPGRTIFWGATRAGRWLFISCDDRTIAGKRYLRPITAFTPDEGRAYWDQQ